MKFLVLSLFVCAASAASFPAYKPYQAKAFASVSVPEPIKPVYQPVQAVRNFPVPVVPQVPVVPVKTLAVKAVSSVSGNVADAVILKSDTEVHPNSYAYSYETSNGITAESTGLLKNDVWNVQGLYQYLTPEGVPVQVTYVADENGYQPNSDILPKAPPVPEAITRALAYIAAHPAKEEVVRKF